MKYLSRYTHRVAIANSRVVFVGDGVVRFRSKDYATQGSPQLRELPATEFLRRFLLPVVPTGFVRIRHYGLLANRRRQDQLTRARQLLTVMAATATRLLPPTRPEPTDTSTPPAASACCPRCARSHWRILAFLAPQRGHPP